MEQDNFQMNWKAVEHKIILYHTHIVKSNPVYIPSTSSCFDIILEVFVAENRKKVQDHKWATVKAVFYFVIK
jgi:hypothetical protein